jgi:hypothetical protein
MQKNAKNLKFYRGFFIYVAKRQRIAINSLPFQL